MRVVKRGSGPDALELLDTDVDRCNAAVVVKFGRAMLGHCRPPAIEVLRRITYPEGAFKEGRTLASFSSDGVELAYETAGDGPAVLLIHGFASNSRVNWVDTGWVTTLRDAGFRVITFDNRGHGRSAKLYDPSAYPAPVMAEDAHRLLVHLELRTAAVIGYSMGARIAAFLTIQHPALVSRAVFAGLAENMILGLDGSDDIADALEAASAEEIASAEARTFRRFAEQTGSDLRALAACMRSARQRNHREGAGHDQVPGAGRCGQRGSPGGARRTARGGARARQRFGACRAQPHECRRRPAVQDLRACIPRSVEGASEQGLYTVAAGSHLTLPRLCLDAGSLSA